MDDSLIYEIASNALFLDELLSGSFTEFNESQLEGIELIQSWEDNLTDEDGVCYLEARLHVENTSKEELIHLFKKSPKITEQNCPDWIPDFREILGFLSYEENTNSLFTDRIIIQTNPIPFEHILVPYIRYFRSRFMEGNIELDGILTSSAVIDLERAVLKSLSRIASQALYVDFKLFCIHSLPNKESQYEDYVSVFYKNRYYQKFFCEYSLLSRLLAQDLVFWLNNSQMLINSIKLDFISIKNQFNKGSELGRIQKIGLGFSDRHNSGKTVVKIFFESGLEIFFKPRPCKLERDFNAVLIYFNQKLDASYQNRLLKVFSKDQYCWVENIDFKDCQNENEVRNYYQRAGVLLYIVHLLNGTDLHFENLVASGDFPVLIDLETLIQPQTKPFTDVEEDDFVESLMNSSVLMTHLLPQWQVRDEYSLYDIGGYSAEPKLSGRSILKWKNIHSDEIEPFFEENILTATINSPSINGEAQSLLNYRDLLIDGFIVAHELILENHKDFLNHLDRIGLFQDLDVRIVVRPTSLYSKLIEELFSPHNLRSGIHFSIELEILTLTYLHKDSNIKDPNIWYKIFQAEINALKRLDIPLFHSKSNSTSLFLDNGTEVKDCFLRPSYQLVKTNINSRDSSYLNLQLKIMSSAIEARYHDFSQKNILKNKLGQDKNEPDVEFLEIARNIGDQILLNAIKSEKGHLGWINYEYNYLQKAVILKACNDSLFDGRCGIALFFAALYRATEEEVYINACTSTILPIIEKINSNRETEDLRFGGIKMRGGLIFGLVKIGYFLGDDSYFEAAKILLGQIDDSMIRNENELDIIYGIAGVLQAISTFQEITDSRLFSNIASICVELLINQITKWSDGSRENVLLGFSHGISGIANALIRYGSLQDKVEELDFACKAFKLENEFYKKSIGGWPDLRPNVIHKERVQFGWANGLVGIGLSRVDLVRMGYGNYPTFEDDIKKVISHLKQKESSTSNLSNGVAGLLDFYIELSSNGIFLDELEPLVKINNKILSGNLNSINWIELNWGKVHPGLVPSLFTGSSGIGYQFLRLIDPQIFKSILLFK